MSGVASGVDGHSEATAAATVAGFNRDRIQSMADVLRKGGSKEDYLDCMYGARPVPLPVQMKHLDERLPQKLTGPTLEDEAGKAFNLPDGSAAQLIAANGQKCLPFVGGPVACFLRNLMPNNRPCWIVLVGQSMADGRGSESKAEVAFSSDHAWFGLDFERTSSPLGPYSSN